MTARRPYRWIAVVLVGAFATTAVSFAIQSSGPQANAAAQPAGRTDAGRAVTAGDRSTRPMQLAEHKGVASVDNPVSEVTTRGHFNLGNAALLPGHNDYDYATSGPIPGAPLGEYCPANLAIVVHGWDNTQESGQERFQWARRSLTQLGFPATLVVGFSWDSNTGNWGSTRGWGPGKEIATRNGRKLAAFIADYKTVCNSTRLHLMGHSLGARVVLFAIHALHTDPWYGWNAELAGTVIETVHVVGAAVDAQRPQTNEIFGVPIQEEVGTFHAYYSDEDDVLQFVYFYRENNVALGQVGILNPALKPANFAEVDVQGEIADGGDNHFTYWGFADGSGWNDGAMNRVFENLL